MTDWRAEFFEIEEATYLNAAGQGPLPKVSVRAVQQAIEWKKFPHHAPDASYFELPQKIFVYPSPVSSFVTNDTSGCQPYSVAFTNTSISNDSTVWDFGDGTLMSGVASPSINYYTPGDYTVTLRCLNDYGCSDNAEVNITVTSATISGISEQKAAKANVFASAKNVTVNLNTTVSADAQMNVYNLIGQAVYTSSLNNQTEVVSLDEQPNGCYIVSVRNAGVISTKRIFISK